MLPWIVSVPLIARVAHCALPQVSITTWRNFFVPALLCAQLFHGWQSSSAVWTVCAGLASYYAVDLGLAGRMTAETRKKQGYTTSIILHHTVTVAVIGWLLLTWAPDMVWGTKWVLLSEVSSVFLNLRYVLHEANTPQWLIQANKTAFISTFVGCRFCVAPAIYLWFPYWVHKALYTILMGLNTYWLAVYIGHRMH